jgi:hypothetical protein
MKHYSATIIGLLSVLTTFSWAGEEARSDAQIAPVVYSELSRKVVDYGDHKVSLVRIRPPNLPKAPLPPPSPVPTAEEQATAERYAKKGYAMLSVTATVYRGNPTITELTWRDDSGENEYRAWSNADFRYLTQLPSLETETMVYCWFPFIFEYDLSDWPADQKSPIPRGLKFSRTAAEYYVDERAKALKDQEVTLAGLDYLHAYYQIHYKELKADYEKREAENEAREKELRKNPPKTPDTIIHFWTVKSRLNSQ